MDDGGKREGRRERRADGSRILLDMMVESQGFD